jgi:hypothetical protein
MDAAPFLLRFLLADRAIRVHGLYHRYPQNSAAVSSVLDFSEAWLFGQRSKTILPF